MLIPIKFKITFLCLISVAFNSITFMLNDNIIYIYSYNDLFNK